VTTSGYEHAVLPPPG